MAGAISAVHSGQRRAAIGMLIVHSGTVPGSRRLVPLEQPQQPVDRQHHGVVDDQGRDQEGQGHRHELAVGEVALPTLNTKFPKSGVPPTSDSSGLTNDETNCLTRLLNYVPITTATASSTRFPCMMKFLKPLMRIRTSPVAQANDLPDRLGALSGSVRSCSRVAVALGWPMDRPLAGSKNCR